MLSMIGVSQKDHSYFHLCEPVRLLSIDAQGRQVY